MTRCYDKWRSVSRYECGCILEGDEPPNHPLTCPLHKKIWVAKGPSRAYIGVAVHELDEVEQLREALRGVSNVYGCFAGCTGALRDAPADGSGHTPACRAARKALASPPDTGSPDAS
jgi:hypothetical protein